MGREERKALQRDFCGMEDYEYKGKQTGLYRESVGGDRESDDVRDARLLRVFGLQGV